MTDLTIIVPCFNEEEALPLFMAETSAYVNKMKITVEYLLVNDGSRDKTQEVINEMTRIYPARGIEFSRNFGKEAAIIAGLRESTGNYVVIMDADLQDPPKLLPEMYQTLLSGDYDSVATYRVTRAGEPKIRSWFARKFYKLINKMSDVEIVDGARDYRMMTRPMVDAILSLPEYHRFSKGIFSWVGFQTKYLEFENVERIAGETSWSFSKLFKYAIEGIVAFTTLPLRMATFFGLLVSGVAFAYLGYVVIKTLLIGDPVAGYPSMISIILFLGGIQLLGIGVIGEYIAKTYMESKRRPNYIIKKIHSKEEQ